jgi:hypothetical protein
MRSVSSRSICSALVAVALSGQAAFAGPAEHSEKGLLATAIAASAHTSTTAAEVEAAVQDASADTVLSFFRKVEFTGLVDTYYTYNFNEPLTGDITPLRNFDVRHNQWSVAALELAMNKAASSDDRVGFRFDLQYGQLAQIFNGDPLDNNALVNVQQAYISYLAPVGSGLTLDVGKFVTPVGAEATESNANNNYSRAFLFAAGPYYHVGARLAYTVNDKVSVGGMLVNGWNATGDNNSGKTVGGMITIKPTSKISITQNLLVGPEQTDNSDDVRTMSDTVVAVTVNDKVTAGLNYDYVKDGVEGEGISWQGIALYLKGQLTPAFALAPRFEIYDDADGFLTGRAQTLKEFTLTAEVKHSQGLIFRAEYRRDWSDVNYFTKKGRSENNQNTFTIAFIYAFSSKTP